MSTPLRFAVTMTLAFVASACIPAFAQRKPKVTHKNQSAFTVGTASVFTGTATWSPISEPTCASQTEEACVDMSFGVELASYPSIEPFLLLDIGVWEHGTKEFSEEIDVKGKPVYQRTVAGTNILARGWTETRADNCRDAILSAMRPSSDVEKIVRAGCELKEGKP